MKVLISGAGVAGLTCAYWLKRQGVTPTIVERASQLPTGGYKIDVRGKAQEVLKRMGIYEEVLRQSTDMQGALLVDKDGNVIKRMSADAFGHRSEDDVEIVRGTLCQILLNHIPDVECIFGDTISAISETPHAVRVEFAKNAAREFDLVIGADGVHSNVRRLVFGSEERFARELGLYLSVFSVPNYLNLDRIEMQYSELGRIAQLWSSRSDSNAKACFGFCTEQNVVDLDDRKKQEELLNKVYGDIGWEVPKLLQLMPACRDFYFDAAMLICMDRWRSRRVVLVGDAAYCASPLSGQGVSLALIGAYVLAGELAASNGSQETAFAHYENMLRPFVLQNQALGVKAAKLMCLKEKSTLRAWLLKKIMNMMPGRIVEFIMYCSTRRILRASNAISLKQYDNEKSA